MVGISKPSPKLKGIIPWNKGKKCPQLSGINSVRYIKDRSLVVKSEKKHLDGRYKEWMRGVKNRDNWKCRLSSKDCSGRIEAHHILSWSEHLESRYEINNGISLCHFHHPRKKNDEKKLAPIFQEMLLTEV